MEEKGPVVEKLSVFVEFSALLVDGTCSRINDLGQNRTDIPGFSVLPVCPSGRDEIGGRRGRPGLPP
jgi:hypothetical protein